jgi:hypothetical protein
MARSAVVARCLFRVEVNLDANFDADHFRAPFLARIDHLLTGPGVEVTRYATQVGPGSDHRDLFAAVAVRH